MLKRVSRSLRRHGVLKSCWLIVYNVIYYSRRLLGNRAVDVPGREFDENLGIETTAIREIGSLDIDSRNVVHAVRYQPSDLGLIRQSIADCAIEHARFSFIDYGCGKGRVMFVASEFPFRRILGVEFSRELYDIAQRNISAAMTKLDGCKDLSAVLSDAVEFDPPHEPLLCYFYNPFGEHVMREVVAKLESSLQAAPRPIVIIYVEPLHKSILHDSALWRAVKRTPRYEIYRNSGAPVS